VSREWRLYLEDIRSYGMTYDAVIRNLEVIGEAAKNIPDEVRAHYPEIEWRKIAGLRDVLAHGYFGLEPETLWDIVRNKVPLLKTALQKEVVR
jgi:uncharacterized protein with HEPN domain